MNPFKSFCLTWWQAGLWKLAMVSFGLALGANWPHVVEPWTGRLLLLTLLAGGYVGAAWLMQ
jgi:hypothetical protein